MNALRTLSARFSPCGEMKSDRQTSKASNPLQFIRNELRERVLIAAQPHRDDCLIRGLDLVHGRLSKSSRTEG